MGKPLIGVTPLYDGDRESLWMLPGYLDGIRAAGGLPVMLPLEADEEDVLQLYGLCDGLLLTGGHDVDPALYGEAPIPACGAPCPARDALEARLFRLAWRDGTPVLGICRGIQLMNALLGGSLYQDLPTEHPGSVVHRMTPPYDRPCHTVDLVPSAPLALTVGQETLEVNSYHHQAIRRLAAELCPMAWSPDGLVEAVYAPGRRFCWGVQWHPEFYGAEDRPSRQIFRALVASCGA